MSDAYSGHRRVPLPVFAGQEAKDLFLEVAGQVD
jgi:hypothetical protein